MMPQQYSPAPPRPSSPAWRAWAFAGVAGVVGLCALCGVIGAIVVLRGGGQEATVGVASGGPTVTRSAAVASARPTSARPSAAASSSAPAAAASSAPASSAGAAGGGGIVFGKPVSFGRGEALSILVPATNTGDRVKSFSVVATYTAGGQTSTASGTVNDLLPGQRRAARLVADGTIPTTYESVKVEVENVTREAASTPASQVAPKITFGQPQARTVGGFASIDLPVTNGDTAAHTFGVQIAYFEGDELVGVATGLVNELGGGQTNTATLILQGSATGTPSPAIDGFVR